jgi:adenosylhomocysteine nucleosidase
MAHRTVAILAALQDELSPVASALQLTAYEDVWVGEVGGRRIVARVSGVGAAKAGRALTELIELHRPALAISAGFAGGLDPQLAGGDVVEAAWITDGKGNVYRLDERAVAPPQLGSDGPERDAARTLLTVAQPLHTPEAKRQAGTRERAAIADMETFHLAAIASRMGVPLRSVRTVSDPADLPLPPQALTWVTPQGHSDRAAATRFALTHPTWLGVLRKLGRHTRDGGRAMAQRVERIITGEHG